MECVCFSRTTREELLLQNNDERPSKKNFTKQELNSRIQKRTLYEISSHEIRAFKILDSLRKNEDLCDVKLETDDGTILHVHKVVLASVSPYFRAMFTSFEESNKDHVVLRELNSIALKLLVDFIYSARIVITEYNVEVLLHTANHLMLHHVNEACCDFLLAQVNVTNCFHVKSLFSRYDCEEYLSNIKYYIQKNFRKVVEGGEFLCLRYEEVVELISPNELNDPSEEKVFECVINWVNHNLSSRKDVFPKLMEHVRLPLASKEYLLNKVKEEPLFKSSFECKNYLSEALDFKLKSEQPGIIPETIRTTPRKLIGLPKIILAIVTRAFGDMASTLWYDSSINTWQIGPSISIPDLFTNVTVLNERHLFFLNSLRRTDLDTKVYTLDLHLPSPCLKESIPMLIKRKELGVGALDDCIYAIGGSNNGRSLKSAEAFNFSTQKWKMISEMSSARHSFGVGILNNHLYACGGINRSRNCRLKSVERYCPKSNTWMPVANMKNCRIAFSVGTLNGIMYAIGGMDMIIYSKSVEAYNPQTNIWTSVSDMHVRRMNPGVVVLNGLLYVVGGEDGEGPLFSAEVYNPKSNIWFMVPDYELTDKLFDGIMVIDKPLHFST